MLFNISKVRSRFETIKNQVLEDGKVDVIEAGALLDFIEDYSSHGVYEFVVLREVLLKFIKDDKTVDASEERMKELMVRIDGVSSFLLKEQILEWILGITVLGLVMFGLIHLVV